MRPSTLLPILILVIAISQGSSGAPLPGSSLNALFLDYYDYMDENDCTMIRSYAIRAHNAVKESMNKCPMTDNSIVNRVKRVCCLIDFYLTYSERITLLMMATLYALLLLVSSLTILLIGTWIWSVVQYLCTIQDTATLPTTTRIKISKTNQKTYYPNQNSDIQKILLPPSYKNV